MMEMTLRMNRAPAPFRKTVTLESAVPPVTPFLLDNFTGSGLLTAHTSDSGHTWSDQGAGGFYGADPAAPILSGGLLTHTGGAGYWSGESSAVPPTADYAVEIVTAIQAASNNQGAIGLRFSDASGTGYLAEFYADTSTPTVMLAIVTKNSGYVQLNGVGPQSYAVADNSNCTVKFQIVGSTLSLYFDGVLAWTGTDSSITAVGKIFIVIDGSPTNGNAYDSITGTAL